MTRGVLRTIIWVNGLLMIAILALRLLPNDDAAIKRLLLPPDGCAAPCFMDIRAGETDSVSATRIINSHEWAKSPPFFVRPIDDINTRYVYWQWSGQQPSGVDSQRPGKMRVYRDHIVGMTVRTRIPLGAMWLVLGETDQGTLSLPETRSDTEMMLIVVFPAQSLLVRVVVPKHVSQAVLWSSIAEIESANPEAMAYFGGYRLPSLARLHGVG